ncbi:MAG: sigma-54-dependent transcriptional regulator [Pseudorhodobacter sp.]
MTVPPNQSETARDNGGSGESILLIEDAVSLQMVYRSVLTGAGHHVTLASTAAEGLEQFRKVNPQIVLLDLMLPDRDGLELMRELLEEQPETSVIVITANGSINKAVEAMRAGAHEFLVKPFEEERFLGAVENAAPLNRHRPRPVPSVPRPAGGLDNNVFVGSSDVMGDVQEKIRSVSRSMATVFITGESGTGKELCALAVHRNSPRANGPFIALNCGAIPQDLLESEVFGHVKGSFTGAISDKIGAAAADGGTLFLDEVGEMLPALQTKLLRFLQTSTVQPVGATRPRKVNVRIVCATNRDPAEAVRLGQFREDLFYRLFVVPIHMPPLRERQDDVLEIARAALLRFAKEEGRSFTDLSPEVCAHFRELPWPGNVRQLLNVIRNVVVLYDGKQVEMDMLPSYLLYPEEPMAEQAAPRPAPAPGLALDALLDLPLAEIERKVIEAVLERHGNSVSRAARVLEVSPSTLYRKLQQWAEQ